MSKHEVYKKQPRVEEQMNTGKLPTKLKKEPLVDAVFELRFSSSVLASSVLPGLFFPHITDVNKQIDRLPIADITDQLRANDPNLRFHPLFKLHWGQFFVFVGDSSLSVACKMPYPGWAAFKEQIIKVIDIIKDAKIINTVDRYAIKYVDIMEGTDLAEQVSRLNLSLKLGTHSLTSESFSVRIEIIRDEFIHVTQVAAPASVTTFDGRTLSGVITEIDTICNYQTSDLLSLSKILPNRLDEIHMSNKKVFFECLTQETIKYLEPSYD